MSAPCPKCRRPKAAAADIIRWLSDADGHACVCWDGVEFARLLPDEEAVEGADLLKRKLVDLRKQRDRYVCLALAGLGR